MVSARLRIGSPSAERVGQGEVGGQGDIHMVAARLGWGSTTVGTSLAWPDPSRSRKGEEEKGGGEKEEGSGDSEQDAVSQWNVIIKLILQIT